MGPGEVTTMPKKPEAAYPPGPELDKLVADKLGLIACNGWEHQNRGSAGGPCLMGTTCTHALGACYPDIEGSSGAGRLGGIPQFSKDDHPQALRVKDLPVGYMVERYGDDDYLIFKHSNMYCQYRGVSEAHVICLALLDLGEPRFEGDDMWHPSWRQTASDLGLAPPDRAVVSEDLTEPWVPEAVLYLGRVVQQVQQDAWSRPAEGVNTLHVGGPINPPGASQAVQRWLWKLVEVGMTEEDMAKVNHLLKCIWDEPGVPGQPPPWNFEGESVCRT